MVNINETIIEKRDTIVCPRCNCKILIENKKEISQYTFPIDVVVNYLKDFFQTKIIIKQIKSNNFCLYEADIIAELTTQEIRKKMHLARVPVLYEGSVICGGIGDTTLSFNEDENCFIAYDPVPDIKVKLNVKVKLASLEEGK